MGLVRVVKERAMQQDHKKLERLFMFSEIATSLSFTEAAQRLAISKGYLSSQIKQLESELKTPLLVRTTRNVRLTRAGQQVFEDFKQIKQSLLAIERNLSSEQQTIEGVIRVTAPKQFSQSVLLPHCHEFSAIYPNIKFVIDSSYKRHDLIADDFDVAFRATRKPPENMVAKKLLSYQYAVVASSNYFERHKAPDSVEELSTHNCLIGESTQSWRFANGLQVEVTGNIQINDNLLLREMAISGKGIARLPTYFVNAHIQSGQLSELFADIRSTGQHIYSLQPQLIYPSARVEAFVNFMQEKCG